MALSSPSLLTSATKQLVSLLGPGALELFGQELRKCREEDGEESSEKDPELREIDDEIQKADREIDDESERICEFRDE